ncbi:DUF2937 family protein [Psychromonas antarctica]|jgi:hypothetical protein|uniref:DUF2937 family protein n=1 Tax=Psychromonas antarctica TaxID=67573 RepID=UPI001EE87D69|nr:DUF2937 family protein [Psychromonas antarctica]MCG6201909.1 DUF2937 family protein [Psychromonas antarctica]
MLIKLVRRYSLNLVFALALLMGLQLPNFLHQYETRLDAHYIEAKDQLSQYQALADVYFSGDLHALISKHKSSEQRLFKAEAQIIEKLLARFNQLKAQKNALQGSLISRLYFLLGELHSPLLKETQENYNAEIALNQDSIIVGLASALLSTLLMELLFLLIAVLFKRLRVSPCQ